MTVSGIRCLDPFLQYLNQDISLRRVHTGTSSGCSITFYRRHPEVTAGGPGPGCHSRSSPFCYPIKADANIPPTSVPPHIDVFIYLEPGLHSRHLWCESGDWMCAETVETSGTEVLPVFFLKPGTWKHGSRSLVMISKGSICGRRVW